MKDIPKRTVNHNTTAETRNDGGDLNNELNKLFIIICKALKIDVFVEWLSSKLK